MPANAKPVGSISLKNNYKKGEKYYYIKVKEPNKWEQLHSYIWKKAHGKVPKGSVVIFKNGNTLNTGLSNLHLIKRSELLILNRHFAKVDRELFDTTISAVKLKAMINKRVKNATTD
ncbi:HNH endonuclease signature motif containing protein [Campylobacter ureolyticus]|uniref:HNH endonuclease signature motif containing protein n=1 Tax=Campylobacter ureolyticus TaxID=827 RepID=A0A9Q4KRU7_9BACT|nr:HNH endonuclease signature motif containing protein [Campylobacter ureolyticus]MCZ6104031.1 HNH endonuclease signature motif containing protein [Campylobacter ureolyticus]MCZ6135454.1 HNH endonuclease signature motif containing protein [Campylobacter ureolyticus]MCZ6162410.1 HNH endonuclease signature motif containing protein [Campylobacter ureolyticus]MCZ6171335.1 HNH endonuclease signature motif containing protein [Campylobacter ureolyticus]MDU4981561.1 HNH endonuclease signature motif co